MYVQQHPPGPVSKMLVLETCPMCGWVETGAVQKAVQRALNSRLECCLWCSGVVPASSSGACTHAASSAWVSLLIWTHLDLLLCSGCLLCSQGWPGHWISLSVHSSSLLLLPLLTGQQVQTSTFFLVLSKGTSFVILWWSRLCFASVFAWCHIAKCLCSLLHLSAQTAVALSIPSNTQVPCGWAKAGQAIAKMIACLFSKYPWHC